MRGQQKINPPPLIDPQPAIVIDKIETISDPEVKMFCKALYISGATPVELAGQKCAGEKALGPIGKDATPSEYVPSAIDRKNVELILEHKLKVDQAFAPVKIAVFKIRIARKRLGQDEEVPFRDIALPLNKKFEPWTREVYDYFKQADEKRVFDFNRKRPLDYLRNNEIFSNFKYTVGPHPEYMETLEGERVQDETLPTHQHDFTLEGLRKTRITELSDFYKFTDFELSVFFGKTYSCGNISKQYELYLPKLLKEKPKRIL